MLYRILTKLFNKMEGSCRISFTPLSKVRQRIDFHKIDACSTFHKNAGNYLVAGTRSQRG